MKAWVKILYLMFNDIGEKSFAYYIENRPDKLKKEMKEFIEKEGITLNEIMQTLPAIDIGKAKVTTLDELFELDVKGFDAKVIKGQGKQTKQIGLEEVIKFKPKVIKSKQYK